MSELSEEEIIKTLTAPNSDFYYRFIDVKNAVEGLLDLYKQEKDKCIELATTIDALKTDYEEEKEKNRQLVEIENKLMPIAECSYWNYENHTCTHTCRGCDCLSETNRRTNSGILIDKDRYCRLYEDGDAEEDTKFVNVEDLIKRHGRSKVQ